MTIDAIGCNPRVKQSVLDHKADYLIEFKGNQQNLLHEVEVFFNHTCLSFDMHAHDKGYGRIKERTVRVSKDVARTKTEKLPHVAAIACVSCRFEKKGGVS